MREERLLSVGIDVGTSTTHCVFSALTLSNQASAFSVPRIQITDKTILWRAPTRLTPLLDAETVDASLLEKMIRQDYQDAGMDPAQIRLGAVIITGETARKQNARTVTEALSRLAGDFVVATAGPALESILAGKGSGAAEISRSTGKRVLNLDIGGGTTNMALFDKGEPISDGCLDLGGRLLRFEADDHTVLGFSRQMERIAADTGITLSAGKKLTDAEITMLCRRMAEVLEEAAGLRPASQLLQQLTVEHALSTEVKADLFTFSGGVSDCIYESTAEHGKIDAVPFHDLGTVLGRVIAQSRFFTEGQVRRPLETGHATVIGAGAYSASVSGSTIAYRGVKFPILGLSAARVSVSRPEDLEGLREAVASQYRVFDGRCAICMDGFRAPSFPLVEKLADILAPVMADVPLKVVFVAEDMAKALGQALYRRFGPDVPFLCLDGVRPAYGDLLDIGAPLADGRVIPVIIKTFAFSGGA